MDFLIMVDILFNIDILLNTYNSNKTKQLIDTRNQQTVVHKKIRYLLSIF